MKIIVTGAAGFIGSNLSLRLLEMGHIVYGIDNFSYGSFSNIKVPLKFPSFKLYTHDLRVPFVEELPEGVDVVVHLASHKIPRYSNALATLDDNSLMMRNVVDYCKKNNSKLVFSSTSDVYGNSPLFKEDADLIIGPPTVKRWAYAVSKLYSEQYIHACRDEFGLKFTIMRFFNAYGPNNNKTWWGGPVSLFINNINAGEPIEIHGEGTQTRCYTYVADTVSGIVECIFNEASEGEVFNLGNPDAETSVLDLAKMIGGLLGKTPVLVYRPYSFFGKYTDVVRRKPDITKAAEALNFRPQYGLEEGLIKTIKWQLG